MPTLIPSLSIYYKVILNENLKQQESKFKAQCKKQLGELKAKIANIGEDDENEEEKKKLAQIEEVYTKDLAKFTRVRQLLAKKNQEISFVQTPAPNYNPLKGARSWKFLRERL